MAKIFAKHKYTKVSKFVVRNKHISVDKVIKMKKKESRKTTTYKYIELSGYITDHDI